MGKKNMIIISLSVLITALITSLFLIMVLDLNVLKYFENPIEYAENIEAHSVNTDEITTNLASNNFAVVQINILLNNKHAVKEVKKRMPEVRAIIIETLAGQKKQELLGSDGIKQFTKLLQIKFNAMLRAGEAQRVLITDFKVQ